MSHYFKGYLHCNMFTILIIFLVTLFKVNSTPSPPPTGYPCVPRAANNSVVCVCNATYCDTFTPTTPDCGRFFVYTSSMSGLRFNTTSGFSSQCQDSEATSTITVDPSTRYQKITGFGGAVTDSAAINWRSLSKDARTRLIESYFGCTGIQYNMVRLPIGCSDFSTRLYSYDDIDGDDKLAHFALVQEDYDYKIPMIQQIKSVATEPVLIVASPWSPPRWMKTNNAWIGLGFLKDEHFQTFADYFVKFLAAYAAQGIEVWAVTTQNEPTEFLFKDYNIASLGYNPVLMGKWIADHLGPTLGDSPFNQTMILANDDQRIFVPIMFNQVIRLRPDALDYISGVAVHWYTDNFAGPEITDALHEDHPDKFLLMTEASNLPDVVLGSWDRGENYAKDIIQNLRHYFVGWVDWNLCLNLQGGPTTNSFVDSPIVVKADEDEFLKQPTWYVLGHFAKFLKRGSIRVGSEVEGQDLDHVAFETVTGTIVVVVLNTEECDKLVMIRVGPEQVQVLSPARSIITVELRSCGDNS